MADLSQGTALVQPTQGYALVDYEVGKFQWNNGTVSVRTIPFYETISTWKGTVTITTPASVGTLTSPINGLTRSITQVTPDMEGTGTATLRVVDSAGGTVFALAAQNESVTTNYGTTVPITTDMKWVVTANGTQSASKNIIIDVHYER